MKKILSIIIVVLLFTSLCGSAIAANYEVKLFAEPAEAGTVTGTGTYSEGTTIEMTAVANPGWKFTHWSDGDTRSSCPLHVYADHEYTAYFEKIVSEYTVILNVEPAGAGTVIGSGTYPEGTTIEMKAVSNPGWNFVKWEEDSTTNPVCSLHVYSDQTWTAVFEKKKITMKATALEGGKIIGDAVATYDYSESVSASFTAQANEGYIFDGWYVKGYKVGDSLTISHTFVEDNLEFVAKFVKKGIDPKPDPVDPDPDPYHPHKEFKITYDPGVYGAEPAVQDTAYPGIGWLRGTTFTRPGYIQAGWSWDRYGREFNAALNAPMPMLYENIMVYPYWEPIKGPLVLTVGYSGNGAVQVNGRYVYSGESFTIRPGESLTFGFYPANGNYVYSVLLAGRYREYPGYGFTVNYDMMQNRNQSLLVRFESIYTRPKTGDDSNIALWAALGLCSAVCLGVLVIVKKKKK